MKGKKGYPLGARIKRLMQTDDDVGKIASATPIVVGRAMELFLKKLCDKSAQIALARHSKTLLGSHLKAYVLSEPLMDFIKETVRSAPDLLDEDCAAGSRPKRPRILDASDESTSTAGVSRGRGRPPLSGRGRGRGRPPLSRPDLNDNIALNRPLHRPADDSLLGPKQSTFSSPPFSSGHQTFGNNSHRSGTHDLGLQLNAAQHLQNNIGLTPSAGHSLRVDSISSRTDGTPTQSTSVGGSIKRIMLDLNELPTEHNEMKLADVPLKPEPVAQPDNAQVLDLDVSEKPPLPLPVVPAAVLTRYTQQNVDEDDDYDS